MPKDPEDLARRIILAEPEAGSAPVIWVVAVKVRLEGQQRDDRNTKYRHVCLG